MQKINTSITFKVYGKTALFADPITKDGENKNTYLVPTYSALIGICKKIYNNSNITWKIKKVRVLNEIDVLAKGSTNYFYKIQNEVNNKVVTNTYLTNVAYEVKAYFVPNKYSNEPFNPLKHLALIKKSLELGGKRAIYLGNSENLCYVEKCNFGENESYYEHIDEVDMGLMFNRFEYSQYGKMKKAYFMETIMENGVIYYPSKEELIVRKIEEETELEVVAS